MAKKSQSGVFGDEPARATKSDQKDVLRTLFASFFLCRKGLWPLLLCLAHGLLSARIETRTLALRARPSAQ